MVNNRVIIVVDMLRGFMEPKYPMYCGEESRKIIPIIKNYIKREDTINLFLCDNHEYDDPEFRLFGRHCVRGTMEAEIVPELSDITGVSFEKDTFSAWTNPEFTQAMITQVGTDATLIFMGVCTDTSVFHNVAGAYFHGFEKLVVPRSCVTSSNPQNHETALQWMKSQFGVLIE